MKKEKVETESKKANIAEQIIKCVDKDCPKHGSLKIRGRVFKGKVIKKFHRRVVIEFERMVYVKKYERYAKSKTKIHARLPDCMANSVEIDDLVSVQECRPLSKLIHFVVVGKIKSKTKEEK